MTEKFFENKKTGEGFYYTIVERRQARHLNISVQKDGKVRVTIPASRWRVLSEKQIENILLEKFDFVNSAREKYQKQAERFPDLFNFSEEHYRQHRKMAQELIKSKVDYYCRRYEFEYNRISIRNQSTRWGSCSSQGNLNFSYKLIFLIPAEQNYVVVHELCHLKEQNHSRNFWVLVEEIIPDYRELRKSIRTKA